MFIEPNASAKDAVLFLIALPILIPFVFMAFVIGGLLSLAEMPDRGNYGCK